MEKCGKYKYKYVEQQQINKHVTERKEEIGSNDECQANDEENKYVSTYRKTRCE